MEDMPNAFSPSQMNYHNPHNVASWYPRFRSCLLLVLVTTSSIQYEPPLPSSPGSMQIAPESSNAESSPYLSPCPVQIDVFCTTLPDADIQRHPPL